MKKIVMATIAAAIMVSTTVVAQENNRQPRPERRLDKTELVKRRTEQTVKKYGLNEQQAQQLLALNQKYADKMGAGPMGNFGRPGMRPAHKNNRPQGDSLRAKRQQPTEEQKAEMAAKRKQAFEARRDSMQQQRKQMGEAMEAYEKELEGILTPDQLQAYKADREKQRKAAPRGPEDRR